VTNSNDQENAFWHPKSIEQLAQEQGVAPINDPASVFGHARDLWEDDQEFEAFVDGIEARRAETRRAEGEPQTGAA